MVARCNSAPETYQTARLRWGTATSRSTNRGTTSGISLANKSTADPAQLFVARCGELTAPADAIGELFEGKREEGQRLSGAGVLYELIH